MSSESEERLRALARQLRDKSEEPLDGGTLSRLAMARNRALDEVGRRRRWQAEWPLAVGAFASVAAAAVVVVLWQEVNRPPELELASADELELLASEDLEFFEELEFYQWLEAEGASG